MRDLKFRAFDLKDPVQGMLKVRMIDYHLNGVEVEKDNGDHYSSPMSDFDLMQFTGLSDKNGKPVYEGDVVLAPAYFDGGREVCFNALGTVATVDSDGSQYSMDMLMLELLEVVGNIHQNKDLLEDQHPHLLE